jgi:hypothetical protein
LVAWIGKTHNIPLAWITDSLPSTRGVGVHRWGVQGDWAGYGFAGWRPGGEVWSWVKGKACPGNARIIQTRDDVLPAAREAGMIAPESALGPRLPAWTLPGGHYYGLITGPARSHGGFYLGERPMIKLIQQRLIYKGYVPTVVPSRWGVSTWADGVFERETFDAVRRFQRRELPHITTRFGEVWQDDYERLSR